MEIAGEKINLRPFELSDAENHLANEDKEQIKWLNGGKGTIEGVKNYIKRNQEYWKNNGPVFNFAITDKESKLLGMVEANSNSKELEELSEGDANISYGLYPDARGKGYAVEAVKIMLHFLKDKGFRRAIIRVNPDNKNSIQVPLRCGFSEQGKITTKDNEIMNVFIRDLHDSNS